MRRQDGDHAGMCIQKSCGCSLDVSCRLRDGTLRTDIFPKIRERERSLDTAHPRLCVGTFATFAELKKLVLFLILFSWLRLERWRPSEQSPQTLRIQEGTVSASTAATLSAVLTGYRYRQDPGKGPKLLFLLYSVGDEKQEERLRATC